MAVKLNTYIAFDGDAREAAQWYKSIFGGELFMDTMGKYADHMPVDPADTDKIMHFFLKGEHGIEVMGADTPKGLPYDGGSRLTIALNGDDEAMLRGYWDKLVDDGSITMPLDKAPWGDTFGMLTDKFGVKWMVDIGPVQ